MAICGRILATDSIRSLTGRGFSCALVRHHPISSMIMTITRSLTTAALVGAASFLGLSDVSGKVTVSKIFGDHMVLQQDAPIRIWGTADPGEQVIVGMPS